MSAAWLGAAGLALGGPVLGAEAPRAADAPPPVTPAPEAAPSAEMLLYFAEFEDSEGDFVDPLALESAEAKELEQAAQSGNQGKAVDEQAPRTH